MTTKHRLLLATAVVPVVFVVTSALGGLGYYHFGNPGKTCASCHEMTGAHATWSGSAHATLHCRNCHGGSLTLDVHALRSHANRLIRHFTREPAKPIRLTERDVLTVHAACQACHPKTFAEWAAGPHATTYGRIFLNPEHNQTEQIAADCLRCHGMFSDGPVEDLVTPISTSGPWTFKDPARLALPAIPCLACHRIHTTGEGAKSSQLYMRREQTHLPAKLLPVNRVTQSGRAVMVSPDPKQRLCVQCHAPNAFRRAGTGDDRTPTGVHEGLSCADCHTTHSTSARASCASCHPADSHCRLDVEKMDTSVLSPGSKHNIHTVACQDCHGGVRPTSR